MVDMERVVEYYRWQMEALLRTAAEALSAVLDAVHESETHPEMDVVALRERVKEAFEHSWDDISLREFLERADV